MDMTANPGATMNGQDVKRIRNKTGLTQNELAALIGYSSAQISRIEGDREPMPFWLPDVMSHLDHNPEHAGQLLRARWKPSNAPQWFKVLMWIKRGSRGATTQPAHA